MQVFPSVNPQMILLIMNEDSSCLPDRQEVMQQVLQSPAQGKNMFHEEEFAKIQ